jgi:hypothetical protein
MFDIRMLSTIVCVLYTQMSDSRLAKLTDTTTLGYKKGAAAYGKFLRKHLCGSTDADVRGILIKRNEQSKRSRGYSTTFSRNR